MRRLVLAVVLSCSFGVGSAFADFLGIGRAWENIKRETTNVLQPVEKTVRKAGEDIGREGGKAWEDIKRETSNAGKHITFSSNYKKEINGDGNVRTEFKVNL